MRRSYTEIQSAARHLPGSGKLAMTNDRRSRRKAAFQGLYLPIPILEANYDVAPDGRRFLMIKPGGDEQAPTQINLVLNWFEELKRLAPLTK